MFNFEFYPDEISEQITKLAAISGNSFDRTEIENALHYIKAAAENEYNSDYFRIFYNALETLCDYRITDFLTSQETE